MNINKKNLRGLLKLLHPSFLLLLELMMAPIAHMNKAPPKIKINQIQSLPNPKLARAI